MSANKKLFGSFLFARDPEVSEEDQWIGISSMADRDSILTVDKNDQRHLAFLSNGMDQEDDDKHDTETTV